MSKVSQLFKFSSPSEYALQNLQNGQIFCQHYAAYNDPFEFWTRIASGVPNPEVEPSRYLAALRAWGFDSATVEEATKDSVIQESVEEYFEECQSYAPPFEDMRRGMRLSCFSSEIDNLLMWSHYADGLRGFCVIFDEGLLTAGDANRYVLDVAYMDAPPLVDSFIYGVAWDQDWYSQTAIEETSRAAKYHGDNRQAEIAMYEDSGAEALRTMRSIWQHVFATKPDEWKYERERRLLVQTNRSDMIPILQDYAADAISGIVLGERMPEDYKLRIMGAMRKQYPNVPVKTARRAEGAYTLVID